MDIKYVLLGALITVMVFGAYFIGLFPGQPQPVYRREFLPSMTRSFTWKGFAWSVALPGSWILDYYLFIAHVWLALGRWPRFGENLINRSLTLHYSAVTHLLGALVGSLYSATVILVGCLFLSRWRHVSLYALCYGGAVGVAWGCLFLAPHEFLNWLFD